MQNSSTYTPFGIWIHTIIKKWHIYFLGIISVLICNISQVYLPKATGYIIDLFNSETVPKIFLQTTKKETFLYIFLSVVIAYSILTIGRAGWRFFLGRRTHFAGATLRKEIWKNACKFPLNDLNQKFTTGHLMSASTSDVDYSRFIYGFSIIGAANSIFFCLLIFLAMFDINVELALWILTIVPIVPISAKLISKTLMNSFNQAQEELSSFNEQSAQAISTIRLQRITQTGAFWYKKLISIAESYRKKRLSATYTSLLFIPSIGIGTVLCFILLFFIGIYKVIQGEITIGEFVAMQGLIYLIQWPLADLGYIISEFQKGFTGLKRLTNIYNQKKDTIFSKGDSHIKDHDQILNIKNLSFAYKDIQIINDFNLTLKNGSRLGITGPIGSGKTTLINIMAGIERNVQGEILYKGNSFSKYDHDILRNDIAIVPQKTFLFADSIKNNISLDQDLSDEEIIHFLKISGLYKDIPNFPQGIDTQLGEWGINLSGGQKQRLALARALAKKPKLLLLDDCFSAIDTITEEEILSSLNTELKETTLIWTAHRKSTLKYCDHILELEL